MPTIGVADILVRPSFKGLQQTIGRELDSAAKSEGPRAGAAMGSSFGNAFKGGLAGIGAALSAVGIGAFVSSAVQGAGQLEQSIGAIDSVFKDSAGQMKDWSKSAATDVGLTSNEFNELGTLIGAQLKNGGTAMDQLAPKTQSLIGLGADLSSMFGGTTKEAVDALSSALKGERDPIERFGVSLSQAKIDAEAAALGFEKVGGALSAEATQAATMSLIMKQTADAHGNFAKESDTFAHKQQVAAAQWGDLTTKIGSLFLPVFSNVIGFISEKAMPVISATVDGAKAFGEAFSGAGTEITSSGFVRVMETIGAGLGGIYDLLFKGDYNGKLRAAFGWEEDHPMVDFLFNVKEGFEKLSGIVKGSAAILFEGKFLGSGMMGIEEDHPLVDFLFNVRDGFEKLAGIVTGAAAILFAGDFVGSGIMGMEEDSTLVTFLFNVRDGFLNIASYVVTDFLPALQGVVSYITTDLIPIFTSALGWMNENRGALELIATVALVVLLPALVRLAIGAMVSAVTQVVAWVMTQVAAIKTAAVYVIQSFVIIGRWLAMSAAAIASGAVTVAIWFLYAAEAVKGAIAMGIQAARVVGSWVLMAVQSTINAIKMAAAWVIGVFVPAVAGAVTMGIQAGRVVGAWLLMSTQSLFHAGRMALAWFIALGPIGWVIAAVIGLVAIVIANWDTISTWTRNMWEQHVKPVFDALGNFISKDVPTAFEKGVEFIGKAWEKLKAIVRSPIDFVINKIINEGLINGLNAIGDFLQLPDIPHVPQLPGFAAGGYTGDGGKYQPAGIVHAGEFVFTKEQTRKAGIGNLYKMAGALAGYASGGLVHPLRNSVISQGFHGGHNGIDFAAPTGTPIGAAGPGRVSSAGWSSYGGGNEIHIDHPNGLQTWYAHLSSFAVQMGDMVRASQMIGRVGSTGNSTGPHLHYMVMNGGWPNYVNPSGYLEGGGEVVGGGAGWNPIGDIINGLLGQFKAAFPNAGFMADMAIGMGKKVLDGAIAFVTGGGNGGRDDGIGSTGLPYLHDNGGVLNPGLSSIVNRTRKPEAILNSSQWSDIHRLATSGGTGGIMELHPEDRQLLRDVASIATQPFKATLNGREFLAAIRSTRTT